MYRMLSPEREDADMGIATPLGTGGRSPPPTAAGSRQDRPPGGQLLAQASLGAGVVVNEEPRTNVNTAGLPGGGADLAFVRGRPLEPRPLPSTVFSMLTSETRLQHSRSRTPQVPQLD
eukprot:3850780-Amphidinium_carterae.1